MKLASLLTALLVCAPLALGLAVAPSVAYAADGNAVLRKLDKDAQFFADMSYTSSMEIWKKGKKKKTLQFDMVMKGLDKQYINFTAPGDIAGMKILMVGNDLWMYSPEFQKVRKVAAHTQRQGFLGSEFTAADMADVGLAGSYNAIIDGTQGNETTLTLEPKGDESLWSKLEITIDKTKGGVTKIRYFDGSGAAVREQLRGDWHKVQGKSVPTKIRMKNLKTGAETVISLSDIQVDQGIDDGLFSRRTLLR